MVLDCQVGGTIKASMKKSTQQYSPVSEDSKNSFFLQANSA